MVFLWPGLPQLWLRGRWTDVAKALGAAVLLNAVLLVSFGWNELVSSGMRNILLFAVGVIWIATAVTALRQTRQRSSGKQHTPAKDTFAQALDLYLKGDYFQTECLLVEMLATNERDLDARLLLATLYRHNRRYDEATKQLEVLVRFEGAEKWTVEIERERALVAEGKSELDRQEEFLPSIEPQPRLSRAA
jgi:uncharacterized protein HemY